VGALSDALAGFGRTARVGIEEMNEIEHAASADVSHRDRPRRRQVALVRGGPPARSATGQGQSFALFVERESGADRAGFSRKSPFGRTSAPRPTP